MCVCGSYGVGVESIMGGVGVESIMGGVGVESSAGVVSIAGAGVVSEDSIEEGGHD